MQVREFLRILATPDRTNFFVVAPDELGLSFLVQNTLQQFAAPEDIYAYVAEHITKAKAREIEAEARKAPRAGSRLNHVYIAAMQKLPAESVGPLLKAVEEAKWTRFVFQCQEVPPKLFTLMSRSNVVRLPFLSRKAVLGNMAALNHDAKTAERLQLYDGTLSGTIKALGMKDTLIEIRRDTRSGARGLAALFMLETLNSLAMGPVLEERLTPAEKEFLERNPTPERKKLVLFLAVRRH